MNTRDKIVLPGLRGDNPLAFIATLGVMNLIEDHASRDRESAQMCWIPNGPCWVPAIYPRTSLTKGEVLGHLKLRLKEVLKFIQGLPPEFAKLKPTREQLRDHSEFFMREVGQNSRWMNDLLGALVCDGSSQKGIALRSQYDFTAGQQVFIDVAADVLEAVDVSHLDRTLYSSWDYEDTVSPLRLDPADLRNHPLMATNPSDKKATPNQTMAGANALAIAGLASLPVVPGGRSGRSVGVARSNFTLGIFRWPIWEEPLGKSEIESLLRDPDLIKPNEKRLAAMGVKQVYSSSIIGEGGKYKNMAPSFALFA